jgi:hypothetical protein
MSAITPPVTGAAGAGIAQLRVAFARTGSDQHWNIAFAGSTKMATTDPTRRSAR